MVWRASLVVKEGTEGFYYKRGSEDFFYNKEDSESLSCYKRGSGEASPVIKKILDGF